MIRRRTGREVTVRWSRMGYLFSDGNLVEETRAIDGCTIRKNSKGRRRSTCSALGREMVVLARTRDHVPMVGAKRDKRLGMEVVRHGNCEKKEQVRAPK